MEIITTIMPGVERFTSKYEEESDYIQELARLNLSKKKGQWCLYISSIAFVSKTLQAIQLSEKTKCTDFFIYSEQKSFDCATIFFHYLCFYCVLLFFVFLLKISVLTAPQDCLLLNQSDFTDKKGLRQQTQRPQKHLFFLDLYVILCLYFGFSYRFIYICLNLSFCLLLNQ